MHKPLPCMRQELCVCPLLNLVKRLRCFGLPFASSLYILCECLCVCVCFCILLCFSTHFHIISSKFNSVCYSIRDLNFSLYFKALIVLFYNVFSAISLSLLHFPIFLFHITTTTTLTAAKKYLTK